jgi:hypothetical protein
VYFHLLAYYMTQFLKGPCHKVFPFWFNC